MTEGERSGLADLEKELTCSICTDLLYQPLTLLDCLHTFCGACLKEWFQFQASTATSLHPYTCPSCRATVQKTQRNASVTTLLEMFTKTNPNSGKTEADKQADREKFKYGDNVLPKLRRRDDHGAEEERRVLEEVQQLSLREAGIVGSSLGPPRERRRREQSRDGSTHSGHSGRNGRRSRSQNPTEAFSSRDVVPPRHVEHQSSLRSLLSASELDSQEMEEEIMRQIMEEGLLDGIDLNNIDVAQEDEITERIAQAYRTRQAQRQRERRERRERMAREGRIDVSASGTATPQEVRTPSARDEEQPRRRLHARSESGASTPASQTSSRPPVSRPTLIDAANHNVRARHGRSSSQGSSRSARRADRPAALAISSTRQAASSASDLEDRPTTSDRERLPSSRRRRQSENQQRSTVEERQQFRNSLHAYSSSNPNSPRRMGFNVPTSESPPTTVPAVSSPMATPPGSVPAATISQPPTARRTTDPTSVRQTRPGNQGTSPMASSVTSPRAITDPPTAEPHSRANSLAATPAPTVYTEPAISCNRCGKQHIEYDLHYNCSRCDRGDYNLCLSCYRAGKGCKHWYGFGWAAWPRYEREAPPGGYPPNHEHPHMLVGHRYRRPARPPSEPASTLPAEENPAQRLEAGVFCDTCKAFANGCYWKCDICNQGAWGFCNDCVNQGRHCTHPLLPVAHRAQEPIPSPAEQQTNPLPQSLAPPSNNADDSSNPRPTPPITPKSASLLPNPLPITLATTTYDPLTFTTLCNICTHPIPSAHTRYHCHKCNAGDYDICAPCYQYKLVATGRIGKDDGVGGWRRCLRGHRMAVIGFEDREGGRRRFVVRDLVGGWALREGREDGAEQGGQQQQQQQPTPPFAASSTYSRNNNWSWRDIDGSIHKYRIPSPSSTTTASSSFRFPPDGGVGLRVIATWSYFPLPGVTDELGFPKNAEIREAEDINGDWFWGVYAGSKGLFPGNYGRVIGGRAEDGVRMI